MAYEGIGIGLGNVLTQWGLNRMEKDENLKAQQELEKIREANEERAWQRTLKRKQVTGEMPTRKRTVPGEDGKYYEVQEQRSVSDDGQSGVWEEYDRKPLMTAPTKPFVKEFKIGNKLVMRERQADGSWVDLSSAPRNFGRSGGGSARPQKPTYKEVVDPDYPDSTTYIDQTGEYLKDKQGNRVQAPNKSTRNEGLFDRIGKSVSRSIDTFSKKVRENDMPMNEQPTEEDMRGLNEAVKRGSSPGSSELMPINISSPQEANSLPPGTWIRLPNGRVGQT